ncbi:MAG TPA: hypothetical protein VKZ53_16300 [Candidatus Angelobacter sp.]|nr:hypothetical protein [Candidatus Angelobacter sp.]
MKLHWVAKCIKFALFAVVFVGVAGYVVMSLWNWLVPGLFGFHAVTFWQAVGLLILSKILFGGFRGGHGSHGHWRGRMMKRWGRMSAEERERFRETIRGRCGAFDAPATETKA